MANFKFKIGQRVRFRFNIGDGPEFGLKRHDRRGVGTIREREYGVPNTYLVATARRLKRLFEHELEKLK